MLVTVAIIVVLVALVWKFTGRPKGLPPGPTCFPVIGNSGLFKPSEAVQAHRNLRKKYGDIYTLMIFHHQMIIVHGYENIRELLCTQGDLFSDRPNTIINGVFNKQKGLMWASGVLWKEHATFAMATLRKFGFGTHSLQGQIMEEVDCLMGELQKKDKQSINIKSTLDASVSNVICSILFGRRFDYEDAKFKELVISLEKMFASTNPSSPVFIFPTLHHLPMSSFGQMEKSFKEIDEFTKEMIQEHRRKFDENNINDFIDSFLMEKKRRGTEGNSTFTDEQLTIVIREIFGAGTETTSNTILWALLALIHYPKWQETLRENIETAIGQSQPKMEDKENLPNVEAFILEVQRYANVAPFGIPHAPKKDFKYNGHLFPKGTCVTFAIDSVMMDPAIFPEPLLFKPERFLDEVGNCNGEQKEKLIPFSTGPRSCIGQSLAKMELFLFLTRFLQWFKIKPEKPNCLPPFEGNLGLTNMPRSFQLILEKL